MFRQTFGLILWDDYTNFVYSLLLLQKKSLTLGKEFFKKNNILFFPLFNPSAAPERHTPHSTLYWTVLAKTKPHQRTGFSNRFRHNQLLFRLSGSVSQAAANRLSMNCWTQQHRTVTPTIGNSPMCLANALKMMMKTVLFSPRPQLISVAVSFSSFPLIMMMQATVWYLSAVWIQRVWRIISICVHLLKL